MFIRFLSRIADHPNRAFDRFGVTDYDQASLDNSFMAEFDVQETDSHYLVCVDMPGINKKDIEVEAEGNELTVIGERRQEFQDDKGRRIKGRMYGKVTRSIHLPQTFDATGIEAELTEGVLRLALPKKSRSMKQKINIAEGGQAQSLFQKFMNKITGEETRTSTETSASPARKH